MKLNIITFNIRCCDDENNNSIAERAPRLAAVTLPYDADIIGFQEYTPEWEPFINEIYGGKYDIYSKYRCEDDPEGVPILWNRERFEVIKTGHFWLSDTPEVESKGWDEVYDCYRICVYVILKDRKSGEEFTVMNTHFGFGDKGQSDSCRLIYDYSKRISGNKTFVIGDFNMIPESVGYIEMVKYFRDVNSLTVNDRTSTFHDYDPSVDKNEHIDYCFIDEKIVPVSYAMITDRVDGKYPSDHFGLHIALEL